MKYISRQTKNDNHYSLLATEYDFLYPSCKSLNDYVSRKVYEKYKQCNEQKFVVSEFGCGTGTFIKEIRDVFDGIFVPVFGLDKEYNMCVESKKKIDLVICADYSALPLRDHTMDVVLFKESIHHYNNPSLLNNELLRVIKLHGLAIVIIQRDWDLDPDCGLTNLINIARKLRTPPTSVIEKVFSNEWVKISFDSIACSNVVSMDYVKKAVLLPVLSYWSNVERGHIYRSLDSVDQEMRIRLLRIFDVFAFALR